MQRGRLRELFIYRHHFAFRRCQHYVLLRSLQSRAPKNLSPARCVCIRFESIRICPVCVRQMNASRDRKASFPIVCLSSRYYHSPTLLRNLTHGSMSIFDIETLMKHQTAVACTCSNDFPKLKGRLIESLALKGVKLIRSSEFFHAARVFARNLCPSLASTCSDTMTVEVVES